MLGVHAAPLAHFYDHFANNAFLLPATAQGLARLGAVLDQGSCVFGLSLGTQLEFNFVDAFR